MIKVGILDDHYIIIEGIQAGLRDCKNMMIGCAAITVDQILSELKNIDVLILDINLQDEDGVTLCKQFKESHPIMKVICLTSFTQVSFIKAMLKNGADGYLFKNVSANELIIAIETVYLGERYLGNEVKEALNFDRIEKNKKRHALIPKLTRRESEILRHIIEEMTNQEIAHMMYISLRAVEMHRMNICAKLGAKNTAGLVRNAIKLGLV